MKRCVIIGAGELNHPPGHILPDDFIIACDGGYHYCQQFNLPVDLFIGDLDSFDHIPSGKTIILPTVKDDTDTLAAVKWAIQEGFEEAHLYGCLGNRLDHSLANFQTLLYCHHHNLQAFLYDDTMVYHLLEGSLHLSRPPQSRFAIFSITEKSLVSLKNLEYEVDHITLTNDYPLGVSNSFTNQEAIIQVHQGICLVMYPQSSDL